MNNSLPETWALVRIGNLVERVASQSPADDSSEDFHYIDISSVDNTTKSIRSPSLMPVGEAPSRARQIVIPDDVLVSTVRPALNAVAMVPNHLTRPIASTGFCVLRAKPALLNPKFLFHFTVSEFFVSRLVNCQKGGSYPAVTDSDVLAQLIPLPPLSEQQRIVDILREAEEIRRLRAQAEAKTAELIPALFHEMFGDPVANPKKWRKAPLGELINGTPKNGLYKPADLYGEGTPIIRIGDFTGGILRAAKGLQRVRISEEEATQFGVTNGQIVINRVNSIEHLGKSLLLAGLTEPTVYESNMMRLDPKLDEVLPDYLIACLQHGSILSKLRAKAKKAINQASINQTDVATLDIPVPPLDDQRAFCAQVRAVDKILFDEGQTLRKGLLLEKALSAHAFTGLLTEEWRQQNSKTWRDDWKPLPHPQMLLRARSKPEFINTHSPLPTIEGMLAFEAQRQSLNRDQAELLRTIRWLRNNEELPGYFTAEFLADEIEGSLNRNPQAIEAYLTVFAARGIVIPVSRARTAVPGKPFATSYRLPVNKEGAAPEQRDDVKAERMKHQRTRAAGKR